MISCCQRTEVLTKLNQPHCHYKSVRMAWLVMKYSPPVGDRFRMNDSANGTLKAAAPPLLLPEAVAVPKSGPSSPLQLHSPLLAVHAAEPPASRPLPPRDTLPSTCTRIVPSCK
jgi:hypothetical protein